MTNANLTVTELRNLIKELNPQATGLSKLRKAELVDMLDKLRAPAEIGSEVHKQAEKYNRQVGEPQVFQGAMHEAADDLDVASEAAYEQFEKAVDELVEALIKPQVVAVRRGRRVVLGKVIDMVHRKSMTAPVLLVVQDLDRPTTRTLHAPQDVAV